MKEKVIRVDAMGKADHYVNKVGALEAEIREGVLIISEERAAVTYAAGKWEKVSIMERDLDGE